VRPLKIAIVKPDSGVVGGFERVVQRVSRWLRAQDHVVRVLTVRTDIEPDAAFGLVPTRALERAAPAYITHMTQLAAFRRLDLREADVVISTQPPSHGVRHDRHVSLFYHHDRIFYDLEDLMIRSSSVDDPDLHRELSSLVREADAPGLAGVGQFLVPSQTVRERLRKFNRIQRVLPFYAGLGHALGAFDPTPSGAPVGSSSGAGEPADDGRRHVLCVSRHEFPKRTELFVAAAHQLPEVPAICVGSGNRLGFVQRIDRHLDRGATIEAEELWCREPAGRLPLPGRPGSGRVQFLTHTLGRELDELYATALCVVAPAYEEDYGLTAIEAMSWGTPVVVCDDGGSLAELVKETGAGLVVPPDHNAIGDAVRTISYDRVLSARLGDYGRAAVQHRFTWARAFDQLQSALSRVVLV
jgi:glycosyltransferase involved in cell wall biosynthesis